MPKFNKMSEKSSINIIAKSILITSGPAAQGLSEVAGVIVILQALTEEGGALSSAPAEIKKLLKDSVASCKTLADELASRIGTFKPPKPPIQELESNPSEEGKTNNENE